MIALPQAPVRSFTMRVPAGAGERLAGLWGGERYVPFSVLLLHHDLRGINIVPEADSPLRFTDIAATAPLFVACISSLPQPGPFLDPLTFPECRNAKRYQVTGAAMVIPAAQ